MKAALEARAWLRRRLRVDTPDGPFVVEYSGRGIGSESVWINGTRIRGRGDGLWFAPLFEFPLGSVPAAVEVRVWPWLAIRSFHLVVGGEVLYGEGTRVPLLPEGWTMRILDPESEEARRLRDRLGE